MSLNRRTSVRILAGAAAAAPALLAQQSPASQRANDPAVQAARDELQDNARRIAQVKLPRAVEPAFQFRAR